MSPVYADPTWWQRLPECLAQGRDAVLVTVARVAGSTPRDIGATVLVEAEDCTDTVGGGNLEFEAIATARRMLAGQDAQPMVSYTLGPGLRQCCGGAVWLLYERVAATPTNCADWRDWCAALNRGERLLRAWTSARGASAWRLLHPDEQRETCLDATQAARWQQVVGGAGFPLRLFGAGHVGRALARMLAMTEARLQWIDPRPECADDARRLGIPLRQEAEPVEAVYDAPPGSWFIVMSHSHALDFELVEAILRRRDARFCGLIGSTTKAARFRHNLRRQGLDAAAVVGLTCPVGVSTIRDKAPVAVAVAITAQILQLIDAEQARRLPIIPSESRAAHQP